MIKNISTIILIIFAFTVQGQNYKLGKVSVEELEEKINPNDTIANATILYKKHDVRFEYRENEDGFFQIISVHERIKIYNKDGFNWATKKIKLYNKSASNSEKLQTLKAYTYNLEGGKVVKEKLKKDGIFDEVANKYWKYKTLTLPNIKEGSVIEIKYEIISPYKQIDDIKLQYSIPVKKYEVYVKTPEYYVFNKLLNPRAAYHPKLETSRRNVSIPFAYIEDVISSKLSNVPALRDEPMVDNINNYAAKLIMELSMTRFPNRMTNSYATSWEKVTKTIYDIPSFGDQLRKKSYFEDDIDALISGESDLGVKTNLIYNFVKSKVKWNSYYGYTTDVGVRKAYKEGVGNTAEINLMLIAMLRYAGINANPVLISTKNNGIPLFPTRQGFNYVICFIENEGFNMLLDATNLYSTFNILPTRVLNWQGRVIRENGSSVWMDLAVNAMSKESIFLNAKINQDFSVEGKVRTSKTNYLAMEYRQRFANISAEDHIKYLEKDNGEIEINNLELKSINDPLQPVQSSYDYNLNGAIEEIGDNLYFSPMLFFATKENPFKQDTRNYPISINYPVSSKYVINVALPEGYEIESLPENFATIYDSDSGKFSYIIKQNGNYLQVLINMELSTTMILPNNYHAFKEFYRQIVENETEKVVLKKIL
ncbi:hypothetical protein A9Q87_06280 [Flavobacteriales bacterium 34_180_T64]|nr:hypothetical protein A9Q87_06280 [Flavobacteriales bacterium 34_180_T64]